MKIIQMVVVGLIILGTLIALILHLANKHNYGFKMRQAQWVAQTNYGYKNMLPPSRRSHDFLLWHLNPEQQYTFTTYGYIDVKNGWRTYRIICHGIAGNVWLVWKGIPLRGYCCYPSNYEPLPDFDIYLGQMFALKANLRLFLHHALSA